MTLSRRSVAASSLVAYTLTLMGCVWVFHNAVTVSAADRETSGQVLVPPVKAHLLGGSTVVYHDTVRVAGGELRGRGWRYGLTLLDSMPVTVVALDSVSGLERFHTNVAVGSSVFVSGVTTVAAGGLIAAYIALSNSLNGCK